MRAGQCGAVTAAGTSTMPRTPSAAALAMKAGMRAVGGKAKTTSRCCWPHAGQVDEFQSPTLRASVAAALVSG
jgi:hypothetical protein